MVAGSILPIAIRKGKIYFLFGKENSMEDSSKGFSDFGGGCENGESPFNTAMREGGEELTGFLGDGTDIRKLIKQNGGTYKISHNDYHVHIFRMEYDENLPKYYNANHKFLWERMNKKVLNDSKLFEKIEIQWFSVDQLKKHKSEFRKFYQEIVDLFLADESNIKAFIQSRSTRSNRSVKAREN
jgi:hypothetical protein